ncbi:AraC family transcriptional regulator [Actinopolymorpha rutila]|uniref:AraC-like DNA-binding protein/mannose-6-phosphate isomerase-like protein (Cupin superfamily) n=1 Tax=Actinopolymorpha rutila TaxID=446787 RepID=A0A852ZP46_9ACTN|nr:helix-turn-helix domain-containing protein [Actinopolymorpha rutila]NYH91249.1 AraC-like DNA-binding protein/mannose-6-phosphate isomerase-like protein (cupin superfamily) [Actinopolymorpha rutila]
MHGKLRPPSAATTEWLLIAAGHHEAPKGRDFPAHQHQSWEFTYYREGRVRCPADGRTYWSQPGMIVLTRPGEVHWETAVTAYANYFLCVDAPDLLPCSRVVFDDEHGSLRHLFALAAREWLKRSDPAGQLTAALMSVVRVLIQRSTAEEQLSQSERMVRDAESLLEARSSQKVLIKDIAQELHVSPALLREQFARLRGRSPMEHLQELRLQRALSAIRNSDAPLATVAESCGYNSSSHLSRHVRRLTGRTPGSFRGPTPRS